MTPSDIHTLAGSFRNLTKKDLSASRLSNKNVSPPATLGLDLSSMKSIRSILTDRNEVWSARFTKFLKQLLPGFGWNLSVLWFYSEEQNKLVCRHVWSNNQKHLESFRAETKNISFAPGIGLPGIVFAESKPLWVEDIIGQGLFPPPFAVKRKLHGAAGFPIFNGKKIIGVIELFSHKPQKFNDYCRHLFLETFTAIGGLIEKNILADILSEDSVKRQAEHRLLQEAKEEAETANRRKSLFLANMSHEIRTPLNAIIGLSDLVLETKLTAEQNEFLKSIQTNSENLLGLINDILDFSKIEADAMELEAAEFNFREMVEDVFESLYFKAADKGLTIVSNIDPTFPAGVIGDAARLRQIITNLVGNAIKFTEKGKIAVRVEHKITEPNFLDIKCSVSDTGIGIEKADAKDIFKKFVQADSSINRTFGGTGLGLSICQSLLQMMNGKMWFNSEKGIGSTFSFELRLPISNPQDCLTNEITECLAGKQVLIVQDKYVAQSDLGKMLEFWKMKVQKTSGIPKTMELLTKSAEIPDVIIIDYEMQRQTGLTLAKLIKSNPQIADVKIILFLPHSVSSKTWDTGNYAGVYSSYKPIRSQYLIEKLAEVFNITPTANPTQSLQSLEQETKNHSAFRILLVEDNKDNQQVALTAMQKAGYRVDLAENGEIALETFVGHDYNLILMDLQMPVMNGFETTTKIRAIEAAQKRTRTPILTFTARAIKETREECLACGMDDYTTKPIRRKVLLAKVEECIDKRPLVLAADDSNDMRILLENYLRKADCRLMFAEDGRKALTLAESNKFALILLDMQMPKLNGFQTAAELRKRGFENGIIALTGYEGKAERERFLTGGCDDYLVKPIKEKYLLKLTEKYLEKSRVNTANASSLTEKKVVYIDPEMIDLVPNFLAERKKDVSRIRESVKNKNFQEIQCISHQMKGCGESYGFKEITVIGRNIETAMLQKNVTDILLLSETLETYLTQITYYPKHNSAETTENTYR